MSNVITGSLFLTFNITQCLTVHKMKCQVHANDIKMYSIFRSCEVTGYIKGSRIISKLLNKRLFKVFFSVLLYEGDL